MKQINKIIKGNQTYYLSDSALTQSVESIVQTLNNLSIPDSTSDLVNDSGFLDSSDFKTINSQSVVGSGNINIPSGVSVSSVTQSAYDALPSSAKTRDDVIWVINDVVIPSGGGGVEYSAGTNIDISNYVISVTGITVPTNVSDFTNDAGYLDSSDFKTINNESIVGSGNITIQGGGGSIEVSGNTITSMTAGNNVTLTVSNKNVEMSASGITVSSVTQSVYDTLPSSAKTSDIIWIITDVNPNTGASYTAGNNIDITNDVISVTGITVPTDVSDLNNDSGYLTSSDLKTINYQSIVGSGNISIQGGGGGGGISIINITQSDYDALPTSAKTDSSMLFVISGATSDYYTKSEVNNRIPTATSQLSNDSGFLTSSSFKTIGSQSIVGSGNIPFKTINNSSIVNASGNIVVPTFTYDSATQTLNITT